MDALPENQQHVVRLREMEGFSYGADPCDCCGRSCAEGDVTVQSSDGHGGKVTSSKGVKITSFSCRTIDAGHTQELTELAHSLRKENFEDGFLSGRERDGFNCCPATGKMVRQKWYVSLLEKKGMAFI